MKLDAAVRQRSLTTGDPADYSENTLAAEHSFRTKFKIALLCTWSMFESCPCHNEMSLERRYARHLTAFFRYCALAILDVFVLQLGEYSSASIMHHYSVSSLLWSAGPVRVQNLRASRSAKAAGC